MKHHTTIRVLIAALATVFVPVVHADVVINFSSNGLFSGNPPPVPSSPSEVWATARFANAGPNAVTLTMTALSGLDDAAYVNDWYFNSSRTGIAVTAAYVSGSQYLPPPPPPGGFQYGSNCCFLNGIAGDFDMVFHFDTSPGQIADGTSSVYTLMGTGLLESDFNSMSSGGNRSFLAAVHVQGYQVPGADSAFVAGTLDTRINENQVPEPGTAAMLGLGLLGVGLARRRR